MIFCQAFLAIQCAFNLHHIIRTLICSYCAYTCRFIGPTGVQMVVNCLPLYMPPDDAVQTALSSNNSEESSEEQNETDSHKRGRKKLKKSPKKPHLRKAKSLTSIAIAEIELSDEERQSRSDNELLEDVPQSKKKKKSRMNSFAAHYSVKVHRQIKPKQTTTEETDAAPFVTSLGQTFDTEESIQSIDSTIQAKVDDKNASLATNPSPKEPDVIVHKKPKSPVTKSKSTGCAPELEDTSDPEDSKQGFEVNYLENTTTLPRLKRSSGSVSFPHRISMPVTEYNSVIVEESSLTSQPSDDPQPTLPAIPDDSLKEPKDNEKIEDGTLANKDISNIQEVTDGSLDKAEEAETKAEGIETKTKEAKATENQQQHTAKPENESFNVNEHNTENKESNEPAADIDVEQAKPIGDPATDASPTSTDVSPALSAQKDGTPLPSTQEPSTDPSTSKESASLTTASNALPPSTPSQSTPPPLTFTLLPPSPVTMNGEYVERSGWLTKLSHRKGVFGDKWQKRYFVLNRSWLYYFKKYGVSYISRSSLYSS